MGSVTQRAGFDKTQMTLPSGWRSSANLFIAQASL